MTRYLVFAGEAGNVALEPGVKPCRVRRGELLSWERPLDELPPFWEKVRALRDGEIVPRTRPTSQRKAREPYGGHRVHTANDATHR